MNIIIPLFSRTIRVERNIDGENLTIDGEEGKIEQVIMNLLLNARDAIVDTGVITISTRIEFVQQDPGADESTGRSHVVVSVADDGVGMDARAQEKAFEPFFSTKGDDYRYRSWIVDCVLNHNRDGWFHHSRFGTWKRNDVYRVPAALGRAAWQWIKRDVG